MQSKSRMPMILTPPTQPPHLAWEKKGSRSIMPARVIESNRQLMEGACCVIVAGDSRRRKGTGEGEREGKNLFRILWQFDMSLVLGVRRWPYVRMFHIHFFPVIGVQNTARRNTGRLQAKVIQRSYQAWCIQKTHVDTGRDKHNPIKSVLYRFTQIYTTSPQAHIRCHPQLASGCTSTLYVTSNNNINK